MSKEFTVWHTVLADNYCQSLLFQMIHQKLNYWGRSRTNQAYTTHWKLECWMTPSRN